MRRALWWLFAAYLVTLAASDFARHRARPRSEPPPGRSVVVNAVRGDRLTRDPVRIGALDRSPNDSLPHPVVVLLHGSPGDHHEVAALALALSSRYRVIAPDLPGFGASTHAIPDYSFRAHGRYVLELLDSLHVTRFHILGFSMGGGVALTMASLAPERVASLTLLSSIGAQEFELLGDYHLNHLLHGIQLAFFWGLRELVPHFGALDGGMVEYARNFYDSDQRPLRGMLTNYPGPVLILQGSSDDLVPPAIGPEHHRISPQSELVMLPGNHFMAFQHPDLLALPIAAFLDRVERGVAITRATADPARVEAANRPLDPSDLPATTGAVTQLVLLLFLAFATLISEDLTCIAAGLLVARRSLTFVPAVAACLVGIFAGDLLLFAAGRMLGRPALRRAPLRWFVSEADIERSSEWFARQGPRLILATRFIPGTRLPTYLAAGILHTRALTFAGVFLVAASMWTPLLVGVSALSGRQALDWLTAYQRRALPALLLTAALLFLVTKLVLPLFSWRGRRLWLGRWQRITRWEFWPRWAFYPPIVLYILWLALRYRSVRLITAVNPGMPAGGLIGESKWEILQRLAAGSDRVARTALLPGSEPLETKRQRIREFMDHHGLAYPIVLKPDVGERGDGVAIVESEEQRDRYLRSTADDVLVQEYLPGVETGIFYYRFPGEATGRIFAITDKHFPTVVGDGVRTLEELILADERAVATAPTLLARHAGHLTTVPAAGVTVPLVRLGTHCRGATFYDGEALRSEALLEAIDRASQGFPGFWFGRYDVRSPSKTALREGRFSIIELNGATSEATAIYDPKYSLFQGYRILARQWSILFEIAARNHAAGAPLTGWRELRQLFRRHRRALAAHADA